MTVAIACDHVGVFLKNVVIKYLSENNVEFIDFGTNDTASVHYPEYAVKVSRAIQRNEADFGILICGTGLGMSYAANKCAGIRAACVSDQFSAKMARAHNDANILCFGQNVVGAGVAVELVDIFLKTEFVGEHHKIRVDMINNITPN